MLDAFFELAVDSFQLDRLCLDSLEIFADGEGFDFLLLHDIVLLFEEEGEFFDESFLLSYFGIEIADGEVVGFAHFVGLEVELVVDSTFLDEAFDGSLVGRLFYFNIIHS